MTDKEFKRLSRSQLIDIIYQLQVKQQELTADNERLSKALEDKRIRVKQAGNIAEAALEIHNVMASAQAAAEQYLEEIRIMRKETEEKCQKMLAKAQKDADAIIARANKAKNPYDFDVDAIMREYAPDKKSTGEQK